MNYSLQERFERIRKEYKKGKRKLEKLQRKSRARAHVQQKLKEQADLVLQLNQGYIKEPTDHAADSEKSRVELGNKPLLDSHSISGNTVASAQNSDQVVPESLSLRSDRMDIGQCLDNNVLDESTDKGNRDNLNDENLQFSTGRSILSSRCNQKIQRVHSLTKYKNRNHVVKLFMKPTPEYDELSSLHSGLVDQTSYIRQNDKEVVSEPSQECVKVSQICLNSLHQTSNREKYDRELVIKECVEVSPTCLTSENQTSKIKKNQREAITKPTQKCVDVSSVCFSTLDQVSNTKKSDKISLQYLEISPMYSNSLDQISNTRKNGKEIHNELSKNKCDEHDLTRKPCAVQTAPEVHNSKKITVNCDNHHEYTLDSETSTVENGKLCDKSKKLNHRLSLTRNLSVVDRNDGHCLNNNSEASETMNATVDRSSSGFLSSSSLILESDNKVKDKRSISGTKRRSLAGIRRLSPRVSTVFDDKESVYRLMNSENGLISSMFQCLIDESKRNKNIEDFELSSDFVTKTDLSKCDNKLSTDLTLTTNETENFDGEKCCDNTSATATSNVDPEIRDVANLDHVNMNDKFNSLQPSSGNFLSEHLDTVKKVKIECFDTCKANKSVLELCDEKYPGSMFSKMDIPKSELKLSQAENSSPTLFESPNNSLDRNNTTSANTGRCSAMSQEVDNDKLKTTTAVDGIITPNKDISGVTSLQNEIRLGSDIFLEQKAVLEIPRTEVVLSIVSTEMRLANRTEVYIVCLCTQSLRFYCSQDSSDWYNILSYTLQPEAQMKKNSGGRLHALTLDGCLGVLLQLPKTTLTYLHLYVYRNNIVEHVPMDSIRGRSVNIKCLSEGNLLTSCYTSPSSSVTKYLYNSKIHDTLRISKSATPTSHDWEKQSLDKVSGQITSLILVQNLPSALLGLTLSRKLHIWNHQHGMILCNIDVSDVCPKDIVCPAALSEQGYLFLPVLNKKKGQEVGSVIVVNPMLSTCETLLPLAQPKHVWRGCNWASSLLDSFLCTKETSGKICIWHIYDGSLSACLDTIVPSCFTSENDLMVLVSDNVLHVYKSVNKVESCI